jgi:hypothetical protein
MSLGEKLSAIALIQAFARGNKERTALRNGYKEHLLRQGVSADELDQDDRAMRRAMLVMDGKMQDNGVVRYPKGTVAQLLKEKAQYADMIEDYKRQQKSLQKALHRSKSLIDEIKRQRRKEAELATQMEETTTSWSSKDWLASLQLPEIVSECLLKALHDATNDRTLEKMVRHTPRAQPCAPPRTPLRVELPYHPSSSSPSWANELPTGRSTYASYTRCSTPHRW